MTLRDLIRRTLCLGVLLTTWSGAPEANASEFSLEGSLQFDLRAFPGPRSYVGQDKSTVSPSFVAAPELFYETDSGDDLFTFKPFFRADTHDRERTHFDIREANWLRQGDGWDLTVGLGKVFWGVNESVHLVDIINQTDAVEDLDGENKLGQPMINFNLETHLGTFGGFILPGFRERTFAGKKGRLRGRLAFDNDRATYDSSSEEQHTDFAARWSHVIDDVDIGLSHFIGTSREPRFNQVNDGGRVLLRPHYDQIDQTGWDVQLTTGPWLWKLETMTRGGHGDRFVAGVGGVEYTIFQLGGLDFLRQADLGLIAEISQDGRDDTRAPATLNDNDVFFGTRLALNDENDTSALGGFVIDRLTGETLFSVEYEQRLTDTWKLEFKAHTTLNTPRDGFTQGIRHDDYFVIRLTRFF